MTSEQYFTEMKISIVIGLHHSSKGAWWGQAAKADNGISVMVEAYANDIAQLLVDLEIAWKEKTAPLPSTFSVPPQLAYTPFKEVRVSDDMPF